VRFNVIQVDFQFYRIFLDDNVMKKIVELGGHVVLHLINRCRENMKFVIFISFERLPTL
jgi:hypothetical protein